MVRSWRAPWPGRCSARSARAPSCCGCWTRTARSRCSARPGWARARPADGGTSRRSWTARPSGSPGAPPTCGGPRAGPKATPRRYPARPTAPGRSSRCASAPVIAARLAHASLAAAHPRAAVYTLLDGLADSVLVVQAIRDDSGQVTDFGIEHVSPRFRDLAGRTGNDLARLTLLEAYPASVSGQGLFARAMQVLTDGAPQHVPGPLSEALASGFPAHPASGEAAPPPLAGLRVARFFDGAIFTWHDGNGAGRTPDLAVLLDHAQRLGRLGGWEENLVTGLVRWTDSAFELFGLVPRSGTEIPLADLHSYVM